MLVPVKLFAASNFGIFVVKAPSETDWFGMVSAVETVRVSMVLAPEKLFVAFNFGILVERAPSPTD